MFLELFWISLDLLSKSTAGQNNRFSSVDTHILMFLSSSEFLLIYFPNLLQVGTIAFLGLTGLLVFMLFFVAATFNAIVISLLVSLAAAGGFLALFFTCVTFIYIGALSVAAFVISSATISAIIAALIATGRADSLLLLFLAQIILIYFSLSSPTWFMVYEFSNLTYNFPLLHFSGSLKWLLIL